MDEIDRLLLDILQQDATLSIAQMAERVGLSATPCWKRIQKLEAEGVIQKRVAVVDPEKIGLGVTVFVAIETGDFPAKATRPRNSRLDMARLQSVFGIQMPDWKDALARELKDLSATKGV